MRRKTFRFWTAMTVFAIANFAAFAADDTTLPANPAVAKTDDKPLVIPDKIPTDPVENAKLAKEILEKAEKNMRGEGDIKTYTESEESKDTESGFVFASKMFVKLNSDGTEWIRLESLHTMPGKGNLSMVFLSNDEGSWEIYGDTAVKCAYFKLKPSNTIEKDIVVNYDVRKSKHDEVDCCLVTEKFMENDKIVKVKQYSIGENDYFIYSTKEYDKGGKENAKMATKHQNVKINIPLEDSLFKIKDTMKIIIANSRDEVDDVYYQKQGEEIVDQMKISEDKKKELKETIMKKINEDKSGRKSDESKSYE